MTTLDAIEAHARLHNWIASEEELSGAFDDTIAPDVVAQYGAHNTDAIHAEFANWKDDLYKAGLLHEEQYDAYEYVGEWL